jgi:transcriptional regulator with XRE-family HTH domain
MKEEERAKELAKGRNHERSVVPLHELGALIRQKRHEQRLRLEDAARESGVSPATLSRLERRSAAAIANGQAPTPDVRTLAAITDWLGVSVSGVEFAHMAPAADRRDAPQTPDVVEAHLRADRNLDPAVAALLARTFRAAYLEFASGGGDGSSRAEQEEASGEAEGESK